MINWTETRGIDKERLYKALRLSTEKVGPGQYIVRGGHEDHYVNLSDSDTPLCDCGDYSWRNGEVCKHALAAALREADPTVLAALAWVNA